MRLKASNPVSSRPPGSSLLWLGQNWHLWLSTCTRVASSHLTPVLEESVSLELDDASVQVSARVCRGQAHLSLDLRLFTKLPCEFLHFYWPQNLLRKRSYVG